jgi:hypothetical protein
MHTLGKFGSFGELQVCSLGQRGNNSSSTGQRFLNLRKFEPKHRLPRHSRSLISLG